MKSFIKRASIVTICLAVIVASGLGYSGIVAKPFTFTNNTVADANQVNADFDTLYTVVNGNLDTDNLAADSVDTSELIDDSVNFDKIDWGTGADQVRGTETTTWRLGQGGANYIDIANPSLTGNWTWTLQDESDTFVGRQTDDTMINKEIHLDTDSSIADGQKFYFSGDGTGTLGDSYIVDSSNVMDFYTGGANFLKLDFANDVVQMPNGDLDVADGNIKWNSGAGFDGIFDHANSADRTYFFSDVGGNIVITDQTVTGLGTGTGDIVHATAPTLGTPVIGDFGSANHDHTAGGGGGTLLWADIFSPASAGNHTHSSTTTGNVLTWSGTLDGADNGNHTHNGNTQGNNLTFATALNGTNDGDHNHSSTTEGGVSLGDAGQDVTVWMSDFTNANHAHTATTGGGVLAWDNVFKTVASAGTHNHEDNTEGDTLNITNVFGATVLDIPNGGTNSSSYTNEGIIYYTSGGGGSLTQDASDFVWQAATNELGIGTNTPSGNIDIVDSGAADIDINSSSNANVSVNFGNTTGSSYIQQLGTNDELIIRNGSVDIVLDDSNDFMYLEAKGNTASGDETIFTSPRVLALADNTNYSLITFDVTNFEVVSIKADLLMKDNADDTVSQLQGYACLFHNSGGSAVVESGAEIYTVNGGLAGAYTTSCQVSGSNAIFQVRNNSGGVSSIDYMARGSIVFFR